MIAATRVELRTLLGHPGGRRTIILAMVFPVIVLLIQMLRTAVDETEQFTLSYSGAFEIVTMFGGLAVAVVATTCGTASHHSRVFQSYVVTGHPRDLLFLGRLAAAWIATLAILLSSITLALAVHWLTTRQAISRIEQAGGEVGRRPEIADLGARTVAADVISLLVVGLLLAAGIVGLATLLRNAPAALGTALALGILDLMLVYEARQRWYDANQVVPIARMREVDLHWTRPWWDLEHAVHTALGGPLDGEWWAAVARLAGCALLACTLGAARLLWREA